MNEMLLPFKVIIDWFMYNDITIAGFTFSLGDVFIWTLLASLVVWALGRIFLD